MARLRLRGVRCFADAEVPLDPHVTVILGENGSGKTTVAEALASLCAGEGEGLPEFPLCHGVEDGEIALYEAGAAEPAAAWSAKGERRRLAEDRLLFAYGRYRRVQFAEDEGLPFEPVRPEFLEADLDAGLEKKLRQLAGTRRTTTLFQPDNHLLRDVGRSLLEIHQQESGERFTHAWETIDAAVRELRVGIEGLRVEQREKRDVVLLRRGGVDVELRELSDGYQAILVIVLDLLLRFLFLEPEVKDPRLRAATVIVDEVDLHLHPRWQRRVVRQLTKLFPHVQWVLTTHSPAVVQGAIDHGHEVLTLREDGGSVRVDLLADAANKALRGAQLGSALVDKHLFGDDSRFSDVFEKLELRTKRLRQKIAKGTATEEDRAQILRDLDRLEVLAAREEKRWAGVAVFKEITKVQIASLKELARLSKEMRDGKTPPGWGG